MEKWIVEMYETGNDWRKFTFEFKRYEEASKFIYIASKHSAKPMDFTIYQQENEESEDITE